MSVFSSPVQVPCISAHAWSMFSAVVRGDDRPILTHPRRPDPPGVEPGGSARWPV